MSTTLAQKPGVSSSKLFWAASGALTLNLAGFQMASYIPPALGVDSRVVTVPYRALVLGLLLYTIYLTLQYGRLRARITFVSLLVIFFWTAYCTRFIYDAGVMGVPLGQSPSDMALYLFGITVPTFITFYLIRDIGLYRKALLWIMLALGLCCLISMRRTETAQDVSKGAGGYNGNDVLNHILFGHMGTTAIIIGLFVLLKIGGVNHAWYSRLLAAGTVLVGVFSLISSDSHGALVAALLLTPVVIYLGVRRGSKLLTVSALFILGLGFSGTAAYLAANGINVEEALFSASQYSVASDSVYNRENMYRDAWREYLQNPLVGSSVVERNSLSYPHNVILESFMAIGTFGGVCFVLIFFVASYRAVRIVSRDPAMAWIPLCFFQQLIGAMFSGGIYGNVILWGMTGIVLGVDLPH